MKFLITNDDGIDAAGLNALLEAAQNFGEATIVAPAAPQSGVSHAVTWHEGVRIEPRGEKRQSGSDRFAIHGTPADCIRLGLLHLVPDANWVLSGINHGANLGADVYYSGTVAAVREAILHGWPGIAFSHYRKGADFDWPRATRWITPLLRELLDRPIEADVDSDNLAEDEVGGGGTGGEQCRFSQRDRIRLHRPRIKRELPDRSPAARIIRSSWRPSSASARRN